MGRVVFSLCIALAISCGTPATTSQDALTNARSTTTPSLAAASQASKAPTTASPNLVPTVAPAAVSTAAPTIAATVAPTVAPTLAPTPAPTVAPTPRPATPAPAINLCGAAANPWNYTFCGGTFITSPPAAFCSYFNCIASFATGRGYVIQCVDTTFSKSGGISGSCSTHGGNSRALYAP